MSRPRSILFALMSALFTLTFILNSAASAQERMAPRCVDVGPLPDEPEYCGCTWGRVLFHGEPIDGVVVTLEFQGAVFTDTTSVSETGPSADYAANPYAHFGLSAFDGGDGALHGDVITAKATIGNQIISRTFRALPDGNGLQNIDLVIPDALWEPYAGDGYTRTLTIADNTLWAGGDAGVMAVDLDSNVVTTYSVPAVHALSSSEDNHVWAAGETGVYAFAGGTVQTHNAGIMTPLTMISAHGDEVLVGNPHEQLAIFSDITGRMGWTTLITPSIDTIHSLAIDGEGQYWVNGGNGAFRHNGTAWSEHYTVDSDGIGANTVSVAQSSASAMWLGTKPPDSSPDAKGGISRFDFASQIWKTYGEAHGLVTRNSGFSRVVHDVHDIRIDPQGRAWAAVGNAVQFQVNADEWGAFTSADGLPNATIDAVAVSDSGAWAGSADGLYRQNPNLIAGTPPTATIVTATLEANTFNLHATAHDMDEDDTISVWEWTVLETGEPLCSTRMCSASADLLNLPTEPFTVSLRVQDDEGMWSTVQKQGGFSYVPTAVRVGVISAEQPHSSIFLLSLLLLATSFAIGVWKSTQKPFVTM